MFVSVIACFCLALFTGVSGQSCPQRWQASFDGFCYLTSNQFLAWSAARMYCKEMGGDLVKITSARENEYVLALARKELPQLKQVWIGLQWIENGIYWADYSALSYTNWAPNEPNGGANEPCGHMWIGHATNLPGRASGFWNDIGCDANAGLPNGIVCKRLP